MKKVGVVFPGYSSQFVGMGKELYDESRVMQEYFEEASHCLDINFIKLCFASSDAELGRMEHAYPSLFLVSSALYALLKEEGIKADVVAGYNQGEYAAVHAASGISFPDGLYLLSKYAAFYQEAVATLAVGAVSVRGVSAQEIDDVCVKANSLGDERVGVGIYESADRHIVTGHTAGLDRVRDVVADLHEDANIEQESVEVGLHSSLMDPVVANFKMYLTKVDFKDLTLPLITNADAKQVILGDEVKNAVVKSIHSPVYWTRVVEKFADCDVLVVVGPGAKLLKNVQAYYPDKTCIAVNKRADIDELKTVLGIEQAEPEQTEE